MSANQIWHTVFQTAGTDLRHEQSKNLKRNTERDSEQTVQNSSLQPREKDFKNSDKQEVQLEIKTEKCPKNLIR